MFLFQPTPFVVDVIRQPEAAPDISVSVVIGTLIMPFVALAVLIVAGLCVAAGVLLYKRWREASLDDAPETHATIRLNI